jgi:hypothetical protein
VKKSVVWVGAALFCMVPGASDAKKPVSRTVPVTEAFYEDRIAWNGDIISYKARWMVIAVAGKLEVCGAGQFMDATSAIATRNVLYSSSIKLNGKNILKDMTFFAEVPKKVNLVGSKAACRATGVAVPTGDYKLQWYWPPASVKF